MTDEEKAEDYDKYLDVCKENEELKNRITFLETQANIDFKQIIELQKQIEKMKNCGNCKYLTRKLINCKNIQICKVNPNNIYGVCDIWELAE